MRFRRLPPAHAPVPFRALLGAALAAVRGPARARTVAMELLRAAHGSRDVLLTDSGTTALTLAMRAVRAARGDAPVALPAWGCYDLASAAVGSGTRVRFYDLDPRTMAPDPASLAAVVRAGVAGVVVAHFHGLPVPWTALTPVLADTLVIEDAAQGAGARWRSRRLGTSGALAVLSFGRGKGITSGRGGALLANDDAGAAILAGLQAGSGGLGVGDLVRAGAMAWLSRPSIFWLPAALPMLHVGATVYREPSPPRGLSAAGAALLQRTWPLADREADVRRRHAARLTEGVRAAVGLEAVEVAEDVTPGFLRLPALAADRRRREAAVRAGAPLGVAEGYPRPLPELAPLAPLAVNPRDPFPGAVALADRLLTLPVHSRLRAPDLERLESWMRHLGAER